MRFSNMCPKQRVYEVWNLEEILYQQPWTYTCSYVMTNHQFMFISLSLSLSLSLWVQILLLTRIYNGFAGYKDPVSVSYFMDNNNYWTYEFYWMTEFNSDFVRTTKTVATPYNTKPLYVTHSDALEETNVTHVTPFHIITVVTWYEKTLHVRLWEEWRVESWYGAARRLAMTRPVMSHNVPPRQVLPCRVMAWRVIKCHSMERRFVLSDAILFKFVSSCYCISSCKLYCWMLIIAPAPCWVNQDLINSTCVGKHYLHLSSNIPVRFTN